MFTSLALGNIFVKQNIKGVELKEHNPHNNTSYDLSLTTYGGLLHTTDNDGLQHHYTITNETRNELGFDPQDIDTAHFTVTRNSYFKNPQPTNWDNQLVLGDIEKLYAWIVDRIERLERQEVLED
mgnify:CR=1 FL=1|jgi:hypothetical protein